MVKDKQPDAEEKFSIEADSLKWEPAASDDGDEDEGHEKDD